MFGQARIAVVLVLLLSGAFLVPLAFAEETEAASIISSAEQQIVTCYQAALDAETAGANITSLTSVLNEAGALLSNAKLAFSGGDFDSAQRLAVESRAALGNFVSDANALRDTAVQAGNFDFYVYFVGSITGALAVIGVGVAVWFWAKKRNAPHGEDVMTWGEIE